MKSITRNKLLIEGLNVGEIVEIGLQQYCKDRTCIVIWPFMLQLYQEALMAVLSEEQETKRCGACQQVVREGKWDGEFYGLIQSASVVIVSCDNLDQAIHIHQNLEEEKKKTGILDRGTLKKQSSNECYRTCEVWSNGKQVTLEQEPKKEAKK